MSMKIKRTRRDAQHVCHSTSNDRSDHCNYPRFDLCERKRRCCIVTASSCFPHLSIIFFLVCSAAIVFALATSLASLRAQTVEADYNFIGNTLNSSVGSIGPLMPIGANNGFSTDTVRGVPNTPIYRIAASGSTPNFSQGGAQVQTNPFVSSSNYSVVLLANFQLSAADAAATKIFDFKDLSSDAGLYINSATGVLSFIDGSANILGIGGAGVSLLDYPQVVLTRDGMTGLVSIYQNGTLAFSFMDSTGLAILGDSMISSNAFLTVFKDDATGTGGALTNESTQGNIARLRLYNGVLTADQVAALDTVAVPEPATWALLGLGVFAAFALRRKTVTR